MISVAKQFSHHADDLINCLLKNEEIFKHVIRHDYDLINAAEQFPHRADDLINCLLKNEEIFKHVIYNDHYFIRVAKQFHANDIINCLLKSEELFKHVIRHDYNLFSIAKQFPHHANALINRVLESEELLRHVTHDDDFDSRCKEVSSLCDALIKRKLSEEKGWKKIARFVRQTSVFAVPREHEKTSYKLLDPRFWHEAYNSGKLDDNVVAYYDGQERELLMVNITNGKLHDTAGVAIDTTHCHGYKQQGVTDCVMALDNSFYCYQTSTAISKDGLEHHSGILSGAPVLFAGEIRVSDGILTKITLRSGHYRPTEDNLCNFLKVIKEKGVDLSGVILENEKQNQISSNADRYLEESLESSTRLKRK